MGIKIILTSYFLKYMYGDQAYDDPLLLSREIIKKAYNEGLYYISTQKNIEDIVSQKSNRTLYVFAGIPTFQDICMNLYPNEQLNALRIHLPYEVLANFSYNEEEKVLVGNFVSFEDTEKVILGLSYENGTLEYRIIGENYQFNPPSQEIIKLFHKEIDSYRYSILNSVDYLRESLIQFLRSEQSKALLDNDKNIELIKECYEELICLK